MVIKESGGSGNSFVKIFYLSGLIRQIITALKQNCESHKKNNTGTGYFFEEIFTGCFIFIEKNGNADCCRGKNNKMIWQIVIALKQNCKSHEKNNAGKKNFFEEIFTGCFIFMEQNRNTDDCHSKNNKLIERGEMFRLFVTVGGEGNAKDYPCQYIYIYISGFYVLRRDG